MFVSLKSLPGLTVFLGYLYADVQADLKTIFIRCCLCLQVT